MTPRQIDRFFRTLATELNRPARIIVTGAAAGALWGTTRPSLDIDFAITLTRVRPADWNVVEAAIARTVRLTGIQANYAEDIDRWGPVSLGAYRRHTQFYRRVGKLEVRLLDPAYWSIGKISRYLDPDVQDVVAAFKRREMSAQRVVRVWGGALSASPRSEALAQFRRQAEHFLTTYGRRIWGREFDAASAIRHFRRAAGLL